MSEMKETAVDVLIHKIHKELDWFYPKVKLSQKLIDEIKAMEKEQMNKMFDAGVDRGYDCVHSDKWAEEPTHPTFEQYYNETFKSE
jgi:uroporphyrinogen-III decarboxylase